MIINESLTKAFNDFLSEVPASRLKQNMVKLLMDFLKQNNKEGLPGFMDDLYTDLIFLFVLLDSIDKETDQSALS